MTTNYSRITIQSIKLLQDTFKHCTTAFIFGKGPTFIPRKKLSKNELYICINDSINSINDCDILVINDAETFAKLDMSKLTTLSYLLIPEFPHMQSASQTHSPWYKVCEIIQDTFKGTYIVYHLHTTPKVDSSILDLPSMITGSNNAVDLLCLYLNYIPQIEFFGVGMPIKYSYHTLFSTTNKNNPVYTKPYIDMIRNHIVRTCTHHRIKYIFH